MIYMVEMNLMETERRVEWDQWYVSHMRMLIRIPGIHATQRFECIHESEAPFVALHEVDGPQVFESAAYREKAGPAGTGEWRGKMNNWSRNIFDGVSETPDVPMDKFLVLIEDGVQGPDGMTVNWLNAIGLDKSVRRRAIGVGNSDIISGTIKTTQGIRVLKPLTPRLVSKVT